MAQTKKDKQRPELHYLLTVIAVLVAIGIVVILLYTKSPQGKLTDEATSAQNISLMYRAIGDRDVTACDQISGAINYTDPNTKHRNSGLSIGVAIITPAMTEAEARQECRSRIQLLIDQKRYEDEVCVDENISHYKFDGVTWPCPEGR
jgi:hypothetical protein